MKTYILAIAMATLCAGCGPLAELVADLQPQTGDPYANERAGSAVDQTVAYGIETIGLAAGVPAAGLLAMWVRKRQLGRRFGRLVDGVQAARAVQPDSTREVMDQTLAENMDAGTEHEIARVKRKHKLQTVSGTT